LQNLTIKKFKVSINQRYPTALFVFKKNFPFTSKWALNVIFIVEYKRVLGRQLTQKNNKNRQKQLPQEKTEKYTQFPSTTN